MSAAVRNMAGVFQARNRTSARTVCSRKRTQDTKGADSPDRTRYLALVSRKENSTPVARM